MHARRIDSTENRAEYGLARRINHSRNSPNLKPIFVLDSQNMAHLCLFANRDIEAKEELRFDYGDRRRQSSLEFPWLCT